MIEYSKDDGATWVSMDSNGSVSGPPTFQTSVVTANASLDPNQDATKLRVRATLDVRMTQCVTCSRPSSASGQIWVYDIIVTVERPTFQLFLDANNDFNPASPSSDLPGFVPGSAYIDNSTPGPSIDPPDPATGQPIEEVRVIAAYVTSAGKIAPPPSGTAAVSFGLVTSEDSAYTGTAMNYDGPNAGDLVLLDSVVQFDQDHLSIARMQVFDYAARGKILATAGTADTVTMIVPKDDNADGIADTGWRTCDDTVVPDSFASVLGDSDSTPTGAGIDGDGFTVIEEYRGFLVSGHHCRTDPAQKDLFVYSNLQQGWGYAAASGLTLHMLRDGEIFSNARTVNRNYINSGFGGNTRDQSGAQFGLYINDGGYDTSGNFGTTPFVSPLVAGTPNQVAGIIQIYPLNIRENSPPHNNQTDQDVPFDDNMINMTIAHEIGHGTNMIHWDFRADPTRPPSIMVTYYVGPTTDVSDPHWNNIPMTYDSTDLQQLRLK